MILTEVYFWTSTIKDWKSLLKQDKYKILILNTLNDLVSKQLISVYGFVIMPNHFHVLWELLKMNGKEMPHASFNKAIAHEIVKDLKANHHAVLLHFKVEEKERKFRIWQRDPLAILMDNKSKFEQKLNHIHNNPLAEKWNLAQTPEDYYWSSAAFYESGIDNFGFMSHYSERLG